VRVRRLRLRKEVVPYDFTVVMTVIAENFNKKVLSLHMCLLVGNSSFE